MVPLQSAEATWAAGAAAGLARGHAEATRQQHWAAPAAVVRSPGASLQAPEGSRWCGPRPSRLPSRRRDTWATWTSRGRVKTMSARAHACKSRTHPRLLPPTGYWSRGCTDAVRARTGSARAGGEVASAGSSRARCGVRLPRMHSGYGAPARAFANLGGEEGRCMLLQLRNAPLV